MADAVVGDRGGAECATVNGTVLSMLSTLGLVVILAGIAQGLYVPLYIAAGIFVGLLAYAWWVRRMNHRR